MPIKPQAPEVYEEALAYLLADARHRHQLLHAQYGEEHCRICAASKIRLLMKESASRLPPEDLAVFRIGIQVDAIDIKRR